MWVWFILPIGIATYYVLKPKKKAPGLRKPDFKPNIVYLVQFPVSPVIRTISPFALKLETYLRFKKVPYEPVYSNIFSKKGQIPYIELNGEQVADSNLVIKELEKREIAKPDGHMTDSQKAVCHLATVAIENQTCLAGFLWRYGYHMEEFFEKLCKPYFGNMKGMGFFRYIQPYGMIFKSSLHGLGRHSLDEIAEFSFQDLQALSMILGEKPFFNGDEPTTMDCTVFGHLVQFVYMPLDIPQKKYIQENCPNLADFVDRMREKLWPDWDEMCNGDCMEGKKAMK